MSFLEERSDISICNKALSRIKQQPLSGSLTDAANLNKHAARECATWYKSTVRQVLSEHHWGLATKRVALAAAAVNDREAEWPAAYVPPTDMAFPVMVGPYAGTTGVSYYRGLGYLLASLYGKPIFRYESGKIYSVVDGATLDYTSFDITEMDFNEAVESLIVMFLSSHLARSVAKNDKLADELYDQAIRKMNVDIAQNLNMNRPRYDNYASEGELSRAGLSPTLLGVYGFQI